MSANYKQRLPMEELSKIETEEHYLAWNKGCYNFFLQRTLNHFSRKKVSQRRSLSEKHLKQPLPLITDEVLMALYKHSMNLFSSKCFFKFKNTGFQFTQAERDFLSTLESVLANNPQFRFLQIYPSTKYCKDLHQFQKMLIGIHIPDFLIFGIKANGYSSVAFEIDGDSHIYKYAKDEQRLTNLAELGVLSLSIPNEKAKDYDYIKGVLTELYRPRSGSLDNQIRAHKRKLWCKTIVCNMTLAEIDSFISCEFGFHPRLLEEAIAFRQLFKDQRKINRELENCL